MSDKDGGGIRPEISRRIRGITPGRIIQDDPPAEEAPAAEAAPAAETTPITEAAPAAPAAATPPPSTPTTGGGDDSKALVVGAEIVLNGSISACDKLVVDGRVEADLKNSREIVVGASGVFKGAAEVGTATIGGQFEGDLTVSGQLVVQAGGRIQGEVRYGQLSVESGGVIVGNMNTIGG